MTGSIVSVNSATNKGEAKSPVAKGVLRSGYGLESDAHAGGARQVSLLAQEAVDSCAADLELKPGDFGENITTSGIDLASLSVGERLAVGSEAILQISEIGKTCTSPCSIGQRLGECIMPKQGLFAKVVRSGRIAPGDSVERRAVKVGAVLTASDRCARGERQDESGPLLVELLREIGVALADYSVLADDEGPLTEKLKFLADRCAVDVVLTTGGTGFGLRDRMPEATLAAIESPAAGIAEAIRQQGMRHTPMACLSRGVSGLRGRTLLVNLPGSARAVAESIDLLRTVLPHALEVLRSEVTDCG
jgi:molybdopterin adenylyltransferase